MDDLGLRDRDEILVNDRLASAVWGCMLIWVGVCFLAGFQHWAADLSLPDLVWFPFLREWLHDYDFDFRVIPMLFAGNAIILLLELMVRMLFKRFRHNLTTLFLYIFAFAGLAAGSCGMFEPIYLLPGFFLALGAAILFSTLLQKTVH
ncbi:MAG TPA: hypothetical protein DCK95_07175 [Anaerolineaceae bacterium]|nr:hypothetical protein [Anaerolineaceae bacterium]